jgi:hypothetical protein
MTITVMEKMERELELEKLITSFPKSKDLKKYKYKRLRMAMHFQAMYGLPTQELIEFYKYFLKCGDAIEIGAGDGRVAEKLGIVATDNRMQEFSDVILQYKLMRQPLIKYGDNVEKLTAKEAIKKYAPKVVFSSWITPRTNRHGDPMNMYGPREVSLRNKVEFYIQLCGEIHYDKPLMQLPHVKIHADWIRGRSKDDNYLCIYCENPIEVAKDIRELPFKFNKVRVYNL